MLHGTRLAACSSASFLCGVSVVLADHPRASHRRERDLEDQTRALQLTQATTGVDRVTQRLTTHLGPDVVVLAMKVAFV